MHLKRETKIGIAMFLAIYALFTIVRLAIFTNQGFWWNFEMGVLGFAGTLIFGTIVQRIDHILDNRYPFERNIFKRIALQFVITFLALGAFKLIAYTWLWRIMPQVPKDLWYASFTINLFMVLTIILFIFGFHFFRRWKEQLLLASELEREKALVQYDNLKNQLNPHFLFNTLSSLNSLIFENPQLASAFLQQLSKVYRYVLENKEKNLVTLETEIEFVKQYAKLLKARFEEGMNVDFDIHESEISKGVAPVTLQILIENAMKHNTTQKNNPLYISISAIDGWLIVKNNIQKKPVIDGSNGQGLENLKNLYRYFSDKPVIVEEKEQMFIVSIPMLEI